MTAEQYKVLLSFYKDFVNHAKISKEDLDKEILKSKMAIDNAIVNQEEETIEALQEYIEELKAIRERE